MSRISKGWLLTIALFLIVSLLPTYILVDGDLATLVSLLPTILVAGLVLSGITTFILTPYGIGKTTTELDESTLSQIRTLLRGIGEKAAMKKAPELFVVEDSSLNAMAYNSLRGPRVALTHGLVNFYLEGRLHADELLAILAHEVGHICERHMLRNAFVLSWFSILDSIGSTLFRVGRSKAVAFMGIFGILALIIGGLMVLLTTLVSILTFMFSRHLELRADSFASHLGYAEPLASALKKIHSANDELAARRLQELRQLPGYDGWQFRPPKASIIRRLFETHPSIERRIQNLRSTSDSQGNKLAMEAL